MSDLIRIDREGHLTIVTITRPEVMNALNSDTQALMQKAFDDFEADNDQWVAIVTGEGERAFSAGHDLRQQADGKPPLIPVSGFGGLCRRFDRMKPVIAAVNGVAYGGGLEMSLACDLIIASEHATFGLPEPRIGLAAMAGGIHRLIQELGPKRAMSMLLTGRKVPAAEAKELGFVNEVVPKGEALNAAKRWAAEILECSPMSIRATKQVARHGTAVEISKAMTEMPDLPAVIALKASDDMIEGPRAFVEKRKPQWKGV